ncbi:hypothetical protein AAY473_012232 [Plecturocebus cupreus]
MRHPLTLCTFTGSCNPELLLCGQLGKYPSKQNFKNSPEMWSYYVAQAGPKLLGSSNPPASASQIAGVTDCSSNPAVPHLPSNTHSRYCYQATLLLSEKEKHGYGLTGSGTNMAHYSHDLLGSSNPPTSTSQVAGTTGVHHHIQLVSIFFVEIGSPYVAQAGLKPLGSGNLPALASQSAGVTDQEIPGRGATRVASTTLLAGAALLPAPGKALPGAEYMGRTGLAGPISTRKTAIGSAEN